MTNSKSKSISKLEEIRNNLDIEILKLKTQKLKELIHGKKILSWSIYLVKHRKKYVIVAQKSINGNVEKLHISSNLDIEIKEIKEILIKKCRELDFSLDYDTK